jgi:hypothetical protein
MYEEVARSAQQGEIRGLCSKCYDCERPNVVDMEGSAPVARIVVDIAAFAPRVSTRPYGLNGRSPCIGLIECLPLRCYAALPVDGIWSAFTTHGWANGAIKWDSPICERNLAQPRASFRRVALAAKWPPVLG